MKELTASLVVYNPDIPRVIETINSLFADAPNVELVIMDNSLKKGALENQLPHVLRNQIHYLWKGQNIGFGAGHNLAVKSTKASKLHLFINPDITIKPGCLAKITEYFAKHENVALVGPKILNSDGSIQYSCKRNPTVAALFIRRFFKSTWIEKFEILNRYNKQYEMQDCDYDSILKPNFLSGCFMVTRKEIFTKIGGFDDNYFLYFEDADLTRRINQVAETHYIPQSEVIHDWMRGSHKSLKLAFIMIQSAIIYFRKWGLRIIAF